MRKIYCISCFIIILSGFSINSFSQESSYFRSAQTGLWSSPSTWQSSADGATNWVSSASAPTSAANIITIRAGHIVTINSNITVDQVVIANSGTLDLATVSGSTLTVNDGAGNDIVVQSGGIFKHNIANSSFLPNFLGSAILEIQGGGILEAANNNGVPSNYAVVNSAIAAHVLWADKAVFNWNNTSSPLAGVEYFPNSTAISVFRFSQKVSIGGTVSTVINGLLEANADVSFPSTGMRTFRNGIMGSGKVGVTATSGGQFIINGTTATLGGTGSVELGTKGLLVSSNTVLTLTADKTINSGTITIAGTLLAKSFTLNTTSKIKIDGTVETANINGLAEGINTTFGAYSTFAANAFGPSSTIQYDGDNQSVTPLSISTYNNLVISGSGTKTVGAGADIRVSGVINIAAHNTFVLNGTNDLKLNGGGTLNINTDAIFDNGGESQISGGGSPKINIYGTFITKDAQGFTGLNTAIPSIIPNIFSGSTVEYGLVGNQDVSVRTDYRNITFSGGGTKTIPAISPNGTVIIKDNVTADAQNKTFGDLNTNLTMTSGRLKVGGTGTNPDIGGVYNLKGGVIEFTNSGASKQTIRPVTYFNIEVSGADVINSKGNTTLAEGGSFTIKTGGNFENTGYLFDGKIGNQIFIMEAGATFKTDAVGGFSGNDSATLKNFEAFSIHPKSVIVYTNKGNQIITPLTYPKLLLQGSGIKTVANGTVTIADSLVIDSLIVLKISAGAKADFQNLPVVIHSSASGTGMIGEITDGSAALLNATRVTVERFIPAKRAFRFLSSAVTTTRSIKDNWMEGNVNPGVYAIANIHPGYGTNITGANPVANDFDPTKTNNPSLFTFNSTSQKWEAALNSKDILTAGKAYRLIIRGDRSTDMTKADNNPVSTNTILRATGKLLTGTFTPVLTDINKGYTFIGNPYASSVDFVKMITDAANVSLSYYVWDPNLNTRGAYVVYNAVYDTTNIKASKVDKNIQPGQAFFVQTTGSSPSIKFMESYKSTANTRVFREPHKTKLSVQLQLNQNEGLENNADGVIVYFDDKFTSATGNEDSYKLNNIDENMSINSKGVELSIEGRAPVTAVDTIHLKLWQFRQKDYFLRLAAGDFPADVTAFIHDKYLQSKTSADLSSVTVLPFSINNDSASFAEDRFSIVFKASPKPSEVMIDIKAHQKDQGIQVEWNAQKETGIDRYEVEQSADGVHFEKVFTVRAKGNNGFDNLYNWFDTNINSGNNFYRIKIIEITGEIKYSTTINVTVSSGDTDIIIFPNPIKGNVISMHPVNLESGKYLLNIYNNLGQNVLKSMLNHTGLSTYIIKSGKSIPNGIYRLTLNKEDKTITKTLIFE